MNMITISKWVRHTDGRKGIVVEIKEGDARARVKWYYSNDRPLYEGREAGSSMTYTVKRTWVKFKDIVLIEDLPIPKKEVK